MEWLQAASFVSTVEGESAEAEASAVAAAWAVEGLLTSLASLGASAVEVADSAVAGAADSAEVAGTDSAVLLAWDSAVEAVGAAVVVAAVVDLLPDLSDFPASAVASAVLAL